MSDTEVTVAKHLLVNAEPVKTLTSDFLLVLCPVSSTKFLEQEEKSGTSDVKIESNGKYSGKQFIKRQMLPSSL